MLPEKFKAIIQIIHFMKTFIDFLLIGQSLTDLFLNMLPKVADGSFKEWFILFFTIKQLFLAFLCFCLQQIQSVSW